jgi:hypothetical protein
MVKKAAAMGKSPAKEASAKTAAAQEAGGPAKKRLKPSQCRPFMRSELAKQFPEILKGFVDEAKAGSCAHLKLTNELLQREGGPAKKKGPTEKMLEELLGERKPRVQLDRGFDGKFTARP